MADSKCSGEKWTCEKCRKYAFDDYDEACAHEMTCDGLTNVCISAANDSVDIRSDTDTSYFKLKAYSSGNNAETKTSKSRSQSSGLKKKPSSQGKEKHSQPKKIALVTSSVEDLSSKREVGNMSSFPTRQAKNVPLASIFLKKQDREKAVESSANNMNKSQKEPVSSSQNNNHSQNISTENSVLVETNRKKKVTESKDGISSSLNNSKRRKLEDTHTVQVSECFDLTGSQDSIEIKGNFDFSCNDIALDASLFHTLFPNPSHLIYHSLVEEPLHQNSPEQKPLLLDTQTWLRSSVTIPCTEILPKFDFNGPASMMCPDPNIFSQVLSSIFDPSCCVDSTIDMVPWSEKHKIQSIPNDICGSHNLETAEKLIDFIENWRTHRQDAINTRAEKMREMMGMKRKKAPSKVKQDDDDFSDFSDEFDDCGLANVLLLTGPVGSGKTSLVHAIAAKCQCVVLEVNTTMKRSGAALKHIIEESTQSHSNLALLKGGISQELDEIAMEENTSPKDNASLSLVLIDEVDLVFENDCDAGFWNSLTYLTKRALSPIILIASEVPQPLVNSKSIRFVHLTTTRPAPMDCASIVCRIAKQEGMTWIKNAGVKSRLVDYAKLCHCDIRKILNELQLFASSLNRASELQCSKLIEPPIDSDEDEISRPASSTSLKLGYPSITSISPRTISSTDTTVLTITGKNFLSLDISNYYIQILIGERRLSDVHVVDDETVTGVASKIDLPNFAESHDAKSLRYIPIVFCVVNSKGETVLTSDSSMSRLNGDGLYSCVPNIEYIFPESIYFMEARSKAHLERRRQKRRGESICDHNVVEDERSASSHLCSEACVIDQVSNENVLHGSQPTHISPSSCSDPSESTLTQNRSSPTCEDDCSDKAKTADVIENAVFKGIQTSNEDANGPMIVTPLSQESVKRRLDYKVDSYLQTSLVESDVQYLMDSFDNFGLPIVSGPVLRDCGQCGSEKSLARGSIFTSYSFCGANEAYLTQPTSIRDRHLLSESLQFSRGLASSPSQLSSVRVFHPKDTENETATNAAKSSIELVQTADEDLFLPWYVSKSLFLLPHVMKETASCLFDFIIDGNRLDSMILDYDRNQRMERLLELTRMLFQDLLLPFDFTSEWLKIHFFLDYLPCLRSMAYFEKSKNQFQATVPSQRRTRRLASQAHYFETQLKCTSGILIANELNDMRFAAAVQVQTTS